MTKKILGIICLVVFGTSLCLAQAIDHSDATDWGKNVQGVQLSISTTTTNSSVIKTGSSINIVAVIRNSSTNAIRLVQIWQPADYDVFLTSGAGKTYHLIDRPLIIRMRTILTINPGEQNIRIIPVKIGKNIETGNYTLQATRFLSSNEGGKLESNLLKVQIE
jgi:hypothetical protein